MMFEDLIAASYNRALRKRVRALYAKYYVDSDQSHLVQPTVDIECDGHFLSIDLSNDNVLVTSDTAPPALIQSVYQQLISI